MYCYLRQSFKKLDTIRFEVVVRSLSTRPKSVTMYHPEGHGWLTKVTITWISSN